MGRPTGEGFSRTARMYATEESDSGVVPMKPSNNDRTPPAEKGEGRPLIKGNTSQPHTYPTQSGAHVSLGLGGVRHAILRCRYYPR